MSTLLTAENIKSVAIAVVVILSGGGLWQAKINENDIERGLKEIHAVHDVLDEAMERQKNLEAMLKQLTGNK